MNRRSFLTRLAGLGALSVLPPDGARGAVAPVTDRLGELLPTRAFGAMGESVTMLGVGGAHVGRMGERDAGETIEIALEGGVRFFDTAESYQGGGSELALGRHLVPKYRDVSFIMSKTTAKTAAEARKHLAGSLRRLGTDILDLWQIHALTGPEDVDARLAGGVLDAALAAKEAGKIRHIGFTGHTSPSAHLRMLEAAPQDVFAACQMPVNLVDPSYESFIEQVMPPLAERGIAVLAMKTLANGGFFGGSTHFEHGDRPKVVPDRVSIREAVHFAWSLPITVLITGPNEPAHMREKVELARSFTGLSANERQELTDRVADMAGTGVEFYKA
ncbi:aldo/keto reductase [Candidatus Poribacteria bacterium]|nr:aldo/keto reductase [Candidatus Poribacteria bacterium]